MLAAEARRLGVPSLLVNNAGFGALRPLRRRRSGPPGRPWCGSTARRWCSARTRSSPTCAPPARPPSSTSPAPPASSPCPSWSVYGATKAFVLSFTEALDEELRGSGTRALAFCPGPVETEFGEVAGTGGRFLTVPGVISAEAAARALLSQLDEGDAVQRPRPVEQGGHHALAGAAARRGAPRLLAHHAARRTAREPPPRALAAPARPAGFLHLRGARGARRAAGAGRLAPWRLGGGRHLRPGHRGRRAARRHHPRPLPRRAALRLARGGPAPLRQPLRPLGAPRRPASGRTTTRPTWCPSRRRRRPCRSGAWPRAGSFRPTWWSRSGSTWPPCRRARWRGAATAT
ncbi:MAG: SDR family NAD(P)-dependent oxidoreductase [Candidatus Moduliflexus flocculans]|nr:SDR family NAD(P)-dependent oxidoreductase [Candidatus Moduliflexus flocculans]